MPYITLELQPAPTPEQASQLARGITDAMVEVTNKRGEVTAVRIASTQTLWTIGGKPHHAPTAYMDIKITTGTNTTEEKTALLQCLHRLLTDTLGELAEASYIVIHELPAENWGYAGISQSVRSRQSKHSKESSHA